MDGFNCGGSSIKSWADGSDAKYGKLTGLSSCEGICNSHVECAGFIHQPSDDRCFWKQEPLKPFTNQYIAQRNNCHKKIKGSHYNVCVKRIRI